MRRDMDAAIFNRRDVHLHEMLSPTSDGLVDLFAKPICLISERSPAVISRSHHRCKSVAQG
jgi:hypothetical protein